MVIGKATVVIVGIGSRGLEPLTLGKHDRAGLQCPIVVDVDAASRYIPGSG